LLHLNDTKIEESTLGPFLKGDLKAATDLLDGGLNPNFQDSEGTSLMHAACKEGGDRVLELLITRRADPHLQNVSGRTPLHFAVLQGNIYCVKTLVEKAGAQVNARDFYLQTPLHLACYKNAPSIVNFLCENGAKVDVQDYMNQATPLHVATFKNSPQCVEILLRNFANTELKG
jgi:ankyrin repeat protein